jgi:hypothetical protein
MFFILFKLLFKIIQKPLKEVLSNIPCRLGWEFSSIPVTANELHGRAEVLEAVLYWMKSLDSN